MNRRTVHPILSVLAVLLCLGASAPAKAAVMIVHRDASWATDLKNKLVATGLFTAPEVTLFDTGATTPTLAQLQANQSVVVYGNGVPADAALLGDRLADYVDSGGGVVTMIFGYDANYIAGRWGTDGYSAFPDGFGQGFGPSTNHLGTIVNPSEYPANQVFDGVNSLSMGNTSLFIHNFTTVTTGSELLATWDNGKYLAALHEYPSSMGYVIGLNMVVPSSDARNDFGWWASTDGGRLVANALLFEVLVPEPSIVVLVAFGGLGVFFWSRRK